MLQMLQIISLRRGDVVMTNKFIRVAIAFALSSLACVTFNICILDVFKFEKIFISIVMFPIIFTILYLYTSSIHIDKKP